MKQYSLSITTTLFLVLLAVTFSACSTGKSPVEPVIQDSNAPSLPDSSLNLSENRDVIAVYDAVIDPVAETFTIAPEAREGAYHTPLTQSYPNVLKVTGYGFTPNFWADIKLVHPFPGSGVDGFDARVIAILPCRAGAYFYYPSLGVYGNNAVVQLPDGYTNLYDILGGDLIGNVNPFITYFQFQPNRIWSSTGYNEETQRWQMNLAGFGGSMKYKFVVDVSTNHPNPPQPGIDNAPEPVKITSSIGGGLTSEGGSAEITVKLIDWQGQSGTGVKVEAPNLFDGTVALSYSGPGTNPDEYVYTGTISNEKLAPEGSYKYLVAAWDSLTGIFMYNEFSVTINHIPDGGNLVWAKRAGGQSEDNGEAITSLSDNSTVITGHFGYPGNEQSATFGKGEANQTTVTSAGGWEIFIAKYNPDGRLAWAKRAGGAGGDFGMGLTGLSDNSVILIGTFTGPATFGPGEANQTVLNSVGIDDTFIARYNPDGTLAWVKRAGGTGLTLGYGISTLSDNSTVMTGWFMNTATFGQGEINETIITSFSTSGDLFIARYNPDGSLVWVKQAGGSDWVGGYDITTLSDNSTVVTGGFGGSITFGSGETNQTTLTSAGGYDVFVARYNQNGTLAWAKFAGGSENSIADGVTSLSDNSTVITGNFMGSMTFGPGESNQTILVSSGGSDMFLAKYNQDGTLVWAKQTQGINYEQGGGVTALSDDSTVVTGWCIGTVTFGDGETNETTISSDNNYLFTARYNTDGTFAWVKSAESAVGVEIATLSDDTTVVVGRFYYSTIFGVGEPNQTELIAAGNNNDIVVARFKP
jgi:hypothetical protein